MKPFMVLLLLPVAIGVVSFVLFRRAKSASLAATLGSPLVVYLCVRAIDPNDNWTPLATLLVSPLVIAVAVITVQLCLGRSQVRKRRGWNDA